MKNILLWSLLLLLGPISLLAQGKTFEHPKFGLQYRLNASDLTEITNGLGFTCWLSNRISTNAVLNYNNRKYVKEAGADRTDYEVMEKTFSFTIEMACHFMQSEHMSPFAGLMYSMAFPYGKVNYSTAVGEEVNQENTDQSQYSTGIFIGFEYKLSDHFSFAGAQTFGATWFKNEREDIYGDNKQVYKTTDRVFSIGDITVMLNYYF